MSVFVAYPKRRKLQDASASASAAANASGTSTDPSLAEEPEQDSKPEAAAAAIVSFSSDTTATATSESHSNSNHDNNTWRTLVLAHIPQCCAAEGIRETSTFRNSPRNRPGSRSNSNSNNNSTAATTSSCLKKLLHEYASLEDSLPHEPAIWFRYDEETPQYGRAMITAPSGTPYGYGLFTFDIYIPNAYPNVPPQVKLLTTGNGTFRFSPNLYENGTVCLSLLGTWNGPRWNPNHSTLLQVLVSIQGLILGVEHPYYLEPGHGGWEGQVPASSSSLTTLPVVSSTTTNATTVAAATAPPPPPPPPSVPTYVQHAEDQYRVGTVRYALLETCLAKAPHWQAFATIIAAHFAYYQHDIVNQVQAWEAAISKQKHHPPSRLGAMHHHPSSHASKLSKLNDAIPKLRAALEELPSLHTILGIDSTSTATTTNGEGAANSSQEQQQQQQRQKMEEAAARGDYITAGQLQSELQYPSVATEIATRTRDMEQAAARGDYIAAGQWQERVQYLQRHQKRLQELQRRMFQLAAQHDFIRAGRFQEQYQILLDSSSSSATATTTTVARRSRSNSANGATSGDGAIKMAAAAAAWYGVSSSSSNLPKNKELAEDAYEQMISSWNHEQGGGGGALGGPPDYTDFYGGEYPTGDY